MAGLAAARAQGKVGGRPTVYCGCYAASTRRPGPGPEWETRSP